MKTALHGLILSSLLAPVAAHADGVQGPAKGGTEVSLVRITDAGYTPYGAHTRMRCELRGGKLRITRQVAGVVSREERSLQLEGDLGQLVAAAAAGELTRESGPMDAPSTVYAALLTDADGQTLTVDLGTDQEGMRTHNDAAEAYGLRTFLDMHCG